MSVVRAATTADVLSLAALRWEFRSGRAPAVETEAAFLERCGAWMRRALDAGAWRAWVVEQDGDIVGQVWVRTIEKVPNPVGERDRHAYLSNLYVRSSARGGAGTRLLDAALAWASSNGIDRVVLWPTARSVRLYERYGFTRVGEVMEKRCGEPA